MRLMVANNTGALMGYLSARHPGKLGHLYSPGAQRGPYHFLPYALDNGAYTAFTKKIAFDALAWRSLCAWSLLCGQPPLWSLVPDCVGDKGKTLEMWAEYSGEVKGPRAFAAQDGMTPDDVPAEADLVFIGGSTPWKRSAIIEWCRIFPRVHVGRINTYDWLRICEDAGAESVDGTGWLRGGASSPQARQMATWLGEEQGPQMSIFSKEVKP